MNLTKRLPRTFFGIETFPIDQNNNIALVIFCDMHQSIHPTLTLSIPMLKNIFDFRDVQIRVSIKTETCDMGGVHFARNNVLHRVHVRMISSYHTPRTSPCGHHLRSHTLPTNTSVQDEANCSKPTERLAKHQPTCFRCSDKVDFNARTTSLTMRSQVPLDHGV